MQYKPWVTLQEALEGILAPPRMITVNDIARAFAAEPGAPPGAWQDPRSKAHAYVTKRMEQEGNIARRTAQRYITYATEQRTPQAGKSRNILDLLKTAAGKSALSQQLDRLSAGGAMVGIRANIKITDSQGNVDDRHRTIAPIRIYPDAIVASKHQLWERFIKAWRADDHVDGTYWFQEAYFDALGIGSGVGEIYDVEMLTVAEIAVQKAA